MKYTYTSYDYSNILNTPKMELILDKDYVIKSVSFDRDNGMLIINIMSNNGISEITMDVTLNSLIDNEQA